MAWFGSVVKHKSVYSIVCAVIWAVNICALKDAYLHMHGEDCMIAFMSWKGTFLLVECFSDTLGIRLK